MRISAKADYALRALIEITVRERENDGPINAEQISQRQGIPHGFLQTILADLRRVGMVSATRGASGGWRVAPDTSEISVADVIRAVDGPLVSVYDLRPEAVDYKESARSLQLVWIAARSSLRDVFEHTTLEALASGKLPRSVMDLTMRDDAWQAH